MPEKIRPIKGWGQHFLSHHYCRRIVDFANLTDQDTALEIGPGTGRLTQYLLQAARAVIAIEIDPRLVRVLQDRWSGPEAERLQIIQGDVLALPLQDLLPRERLHLVSNLPYNIATPTITRMMEGGNWFQTLTVLIQKEVAQRMLARSRTRDFGYFTLLTRFHCEVEKGFDVPPGAFTPAPAVDSSVLRLTPRRPGGPVPWNRLQPLASLAFRHPRKTLLNNLCRGDLTRRQVLAALHQCGVDEKDRPHEVSLDAYCCLAQLLEFSDI